MVFAAGGALAVDLAPPERLGQAIGIYGLSFLCMNAVGPLCVEQITMHAGWTAAFSAAALGALVCAALSLRIRDVDGIGNRDGNGATLLDLARRGDQLVAMLVIALVGSAMSAVFNFHQLYALELGIEQVSAFFIAYSLAAIAVRGGLGHWIDVWGHRRSAVVSLGFYIAVVASVVVLDRLGLALVGIGMGIVHGIFYPSFNAVVVAHAGPGERGKLMALFQAAFQVGMAGGGLGLGLLAAARGYPIVFETAAAGLGVALVVLLISSRDARAPVAD